MAGRAGEEKEREPFEREGRRKEDRSSKQQKKRRNACVLQAQREKGKHQGRQKSAAAGEKKGKGQVPSHP